MMSVADDYVIRDLYPEEFPRIPEPLCEFDVFTAWSRVAARVVVDEDHGCC